METLDTLTTEVLKFRDARDWKQFHNPKDMAISLVLESSELLEHFQWCAEGDLDERVNSRRGEIGDELADVLYWVLLLSRDLGIDLSAAFKAKMLKNVAKYPVTEFQGSSRKYDEGK